MTSLEETCKTKFCKKYYVPHTMKRRYHSNMKGLNKTRRKQELKRLKTQEPEEYTKCVSTFCNTPECKDTIFEPGKGLPKGYIEKEIDGYLKKNPEPRSTKEQKIKRRKTQIRTHINMRKHFFKGKTNVLKDGFYEEFPKDKLADLKKKGAISGCAFAAL